MRSIGFRAAPAALLLVPLLVAFPAAQRTSRPAAAGIDLARLDEIPPLVEQAIGDKKLPGAVVLVGRGDRVVYEKAIGRRAVEPAPEAMTLDTIFDVASLTKVVATTTSVMKLVEDGQDPADRSRVDLHSRLRALRQGRHHDPPPDDAHLGAAAGPRSRRRRGRGYDKAIELAIDEVPTSPPGERFVYSDINYFLLGDIVAARQRHAARSSSRRRTSSSRSG